MLVWGYTLSVTGYMHSEAARLRFEAGAELLGSWGKDQVRLCSKWSTTRALVLEESSQHQT